MQVLVLSRTLAVKTLQLELEYICSALEDEALDVVQGTQDAGFLLTRCSFLLTSGGPRGLNQLSKDHLTVAPPPPPPPGNDESLHSPDPARSSRVVARVGGFGCAVCAFASAVQARRPDNVMDADCTRLCTLLELSAATSVPEE